MVAASKMSTTCEMARMMAEAHRRKLDMCAALEDIADSLPANVDAFKCLSVANALAPLMREIHHFEESVIFPIFEARRTGDAHALSAQRLRAEHVEDQAYAEELTEALMAIGHGAQVSNPEAVGFMLRGFFESTRRHVAFEREHVLPVIDAQDSCARIPIGRSAPRAG